MFCDGVWLRRMHRLLDGIGYGCVFFYGTDWAVTGHKWM
jgi:hypothetical protein